MEWVSYIAPLLKGAWVTVQLAVCSTILGGLFAVIAVLFIASGGELGGKKTVEGDQDLPPVATAQQAQ